MIYIPRTDDKNGADCTGTDGDANRTYTLAQANPVSAGMNVHVGATWQDPTIDYTYNNGVLTFLNPVLNFMHIVITYYTTDAAAPTSSSIYTNTLQVVRVTGIGVEVFDENVGTGTGIINSFDLDNGNVIDGSYILRYGTANSNSLTALIETTDYVISIDEGRILLTAAGITKLGTNILYASYIYSPKLSNTIIASFLNGTDKELERKTGNYWGTPVSTTEYHSWNKVSYPDTDEPFATEYNEPDYLMLKFKNVTSITSVKFVQRGGSVLTYDTLNSYDYDVEETTGKLTFINRSIPNGTRNVEIIYLHGSATVDPEISELAAYLAGIRVYANITGGSYDDVTGYTLGRKQVQIGEVYVNVREVTRQFETRIKEILNDVGEKFYVC